MVTWVCPPPYITSPPGIFNIIEMVFSILTFALSSSGWGYSAEGTNHWWVNEGGGWVDFVGVLGFILIGIIFVLHILNALQELFAKYTIEPIVYTALAVMFLIAGIVAAASKHMENAVKASSFFAFATMATLIVHMCWWYWATKRSSNAPTNQTIA